MKNGRSPWEETAEAKTSAIVSPSSTSLMPSSPSRARSGLVLPFHSPRADGAVAGSSASAWPASAALKARRALLGERLAPLLPVRAGKDGIRLRARLTGDLGGPLG